MQYTVRPNVIKCLMVEVIVMASTKWHILTFLLSVIFTLFLWHLHNILMPFLWCFIPFLWHSFIIFLHYVFVYVSLARKEKNRLQNCFEKFIAEKAIRLFRMIIIFFFFFLSTSFSFFYFFSTVSFSPSCSLLVLKKCKSNFRVQVEY